VVGLASRLEHAGDGREEEARADGPDIGTVISSKVTREPAVEPWRPVPVFKAFRWSRTGCTGFSRAIV
jgi:hypothetical protein